jgi:cytoskeletal protein CcmA (bactofilin family)
MVWNKKNEEEAKSRSSAPVPEPPAPPRPATPPPPAASAAPAAPAYRPELPRSSAVLGQSVVVKGQIFSQEDLTIDGDVQGTIDLADHRLTVGPKGKVVVDTIKAREVIVMGSLKGSIDATDKVFIRKDAQLIGDVQTAGIVIEDGAYFKGGIDIRKPETPRKP